MEMVTFSINSISVFLVHYSVKHFEDGEVVFKC